MCYPHFRVDTSAYFEIYFFFTKSHKDRQTASSSACGGKEFQKKTIKADLGQDKTKADSSRDKTKANSSRDILDPKYLLIVAAQNPEAPFSTVDIIER